MNTYGKTKCPNCGEMNTMFRPLKVLQKKPMWDAVFCCLCGKNYRHTDILKGTKQNGD